jgi:Glycosyl transferase family 11
MKCPIPDVPASLGITHSLSILCGLSQTALPPMIHLILRGRTGNILFQYALGRVLAEKHGVPLVLGASWYNREGWAEVSHFLKLPIRANVVRGGIPGSIASRVLRKLTRKHYWEYLGLPILKEHDLDHSFDPRFLNAPAVCVLSGYFQSPRYFQSMAEELRAELKELISRGVHASCVHTSASCGSSLESRLTQPNSIAVHVRRGDFLRLPVFHVCDEYYYRRSMEEMRAQVPDARFFIFSDDPAWCHRTFTDPDTEVIDSSAEGNPLHDLYLMSLAGHHIIANSSYSWWAAWLGDKSDQQVIMPGRWYARDIIAPIEDKRLPHWKTIDHR